ncbi:ornithine--oxo-acid transaminase [Phycicoccus endophyticus]|uniref:ornithine aminotransferase n=1 Tax=Phycicoccus endophyticus TaxID=1690220 RepID=A0A7G9R571_9MICO|nr:ornithine--oxo-acid transaminase [Phycicoccus endophyticus]NHI20651.1 ornithine--oxo-acid transaminase [Phycicoccus endophyticus]QNN50746.1 ornithine--oxo-acid transaminase [Phycicoccus endophyticus]GGL43435.1 ornithine--oxo-acid transaminase [Phycicoccus endophyticus]
MTPQHGALDTGGHIALTEHYAAHNYHPLPVVLSHGEGAWVTDVEGRRYLDCLAGYSALNFGHGHPRLLARAHAQLDRLTLTSRAFLNDQLGPFAQALAGLTGTDMVLPMNTGAEAVETAIKVARKWGYRVKGVPEDAATIVVMEGNFHGRTTTIVSFSDDKVAHDEYGPFTPGFRTVRYGDADALRAAVDDTTVAVLLEPVQGEGGVVIPPEGYLRAVREICDDAGVLMVADEVQSGLARTGRTFACDHEEVRPDVYVLGKALGGGLYPVSAIAADEPVLGVITPGSHGSTFGGNPLAAAIGHEVVQMLEEGEFQARATRLGAQLADGLRPLVGQGLDAIRVRGLWAGLDITAGGPTGRELSERLLERGVLAKDTHGSTIRLAPPLVATEGEVDLLVEAVTGALG